MFQGAGADALPVDVRLSVHGDTLEPLWNLFDLTPEGRGTDWYPEFSNS